MADSKTIGAHLLKRSLSKQAADHLRQAILDGKLAPGQRIVENDLARTFQMSRGPVRDALRALETEGLVTRQANRSTFVTELTRRDAEEIYSLRRALESVALEYAILSASDADLCRLEAIVQRMDELAARDHDPAQAVDADLEFHHTLCIISGNRRVLAAWEVQRAQVHMLIAAHRARHPSAFRQLTVPYHRRLLDAIRQRDIEQAQDVLRDHLSASLLGVLDAHP